MKITVQVEVPELKDKCTCSYCDFSGITQQDDKLIKLICYPFQVLVSNPCPACLRARKEANAKV